MDGAAPGGGHEAVVQLLVEKGADVAANDDDGQTALDRAAECEGEAVVQLLTSLTLGL
jgi:ankyrin repeat protein